MASLPVGLYSSTLPCTNVACILMMRTALNTSALRLCHGIGCGRGRPICPRRLAPCPCGGVMHRSRWHSRCQWARSLSQWGPSPGRLGWAHCTAPASGWPLAAAEPGPGAPGGGNGPTAVRKRASAGRPSATVAVTGAGTAGTAELALALTNGQGTWTRTKVTQLSLSLGAPRARAQRLPLARAKDKTRPGPRR
jgi:hypothetical protein